MSYQTTELQRTQIKEVYDNALKWVLKVNKMTDDQVFAVWSRFKRKGIIK